MCEPLTWKPPPAFAVTVPTVSAVPSPQLMLAAKSAAVAPGLASPNVATTTVPLDVPSVAPTATPLAVSAASATVAGPSLAMADALATAVAVGGDEALEVVGGVGGYAAYLIRPDGSETGTGGITFVS